MYNQTTKRYTMQDSSGTYNWMTENADDGWRSLTEEELYEWIDMMIEQAKTLDLYEVDEMAETMTFPCFGYTTADIFQDKDEFKAFKEAEIEEDYAEERDIVFDYLRSWEATA